MFLLPLPLDRVFPEIFPFRVAIKVGHVMDHILCKDFRIHLIRLATVLSGSLDNLKDADLLGASIHLYWAS